MTGVLTRALLAVVVLAAVALAGVGWHYAGEILVAPVAAGEVAAPGSDVTVRDVEVDGPLGVYPAWLVDPDPRVAEQTWALFVHGRGGSRSACGDILPTLVDLGLPTLCVSYRNDAQAPPDPEGLYRQGDAEADDVAAAMDYAASHGARRFVLVGWSMGGQITANVLRRSPRREAVTAVVWDAPVLDWGPAIRAGAVDREVPLWLVPVGMFFSELRAGIDYDALDQVAHAGEFETPILLFHGTADRTVPVAGSDRFAAARPDLVTYERLPGVGHVAARRADPRRYDRTLRRFLAPHLAASAARGARSEVSDEERRQPRRLVRVELHGRGAHRVVPQAQDDEVGVGVPGDPHGTAAGVGEQRTARRLQRDG